MVISLDVDEGGFWLLSSEKTYDDHTITLFPPSFQTRYTSQVHLRSPTVTVQPSLLNLKLSFIKDEEDVEDEEDEEVEEVEEGGGSSSATKRKFQLQPKLGAFGIVKVSELSNEEVDKVKLENILFFAVQFLIKTNLTLSSLKKPEMRSFIQSCTGSNHEYKDGTFGEHALNSEIDRQIAMWINWLVALLKDMHSKYKCPFLQLLHDGKIFTFQKIYIYESISLSQQSASPFALISLKTFLFSILHYFTSF